MAVTPNIGLPLNDNWTSGSVVNWAKEINAENINSAFKKIDSSIGAGTKFLTTAPTQNNISGYIKFVVLQNEPATYYNGYLYIITG